jgi:hypothetical protein
MSHAVNVKEALSSGQKSTSSRENLSSLSASPPEMVAVATLSEEARRLLEEQRVVEAAQLAEEGALYRHSLNALRVACLMVHSGEAKKPYQAEIKTGFGRRFIQRHIDLNTHDACQSLDTFRSAKVGRQKDIPSPVAAIMRARVGQADMEQGTLVHYPQVKSSSSNKGGFDPNTVEGGGSVRLCTRSCTSGCRPSTPMGPPCPS